MRALPRQCFVQPRHICQTVHKFHLNNQTNRNNENLAMQTRQAFTMKPEQFVALQRHQETNHQQHPFSFQSNENKMSASQTMLASNPRCVTDTHLMSTIVAANGNSSIMSPFGKFQFSKEHSGLKEIHHTYFMEQNILSTPNRRTSSNIYWEEPVQIAIRKNQFKYLLGRTGSNNYWEQPVQTAMRKNKFK